MTENPQCPDYSSHEQNAIEALFPSAVPPFLTVAESDAVDAAAEAEYRECEGH